MRDRTDKLAQKLLEEGGKTLDFFRGLDAGQWMLEVYVEDNHWRVKDVLAHFVVTEIGIPRIIMNILNGGEGAPESFDLDEYNVRKVSGLENQSPSSLLEEFQQWRGETIQMVKGLMDTDLDKIGRHPYLGRASIEDMIKLMYRHNQIHQRDLRRLILVD